MDYAYFVSSKENGETLTAGRSWSYDEAVAIAQTILKEEEKALLESGVDFCQVVETDNGYIIETSDGERLSEIMISEEAVS